MRQTFDALNDYYSSYDEAGRLASRHGQVEFLTTLRYVERYLRPGMRLAEIGAGTGRYTLYLARQGYAVDAVELIPHNLEQLRAQLTPELRVRAMQGNALDLSALAQDQYDLTLLLGPMYHLFEPRDQERALEEAVRITRPGGVVCVAYCMMDASIYQYGFAGGQIERLLAEGLIDDQQFVAKSTPAELFQLYRKEQIDRLIAALPVRRLHLVATDLYTNHMRAAVDAMDDARFALYLKYHFALCERPDMLGLTHHSLDVMRKEGACGEGGT